MLFLFLFPTVIFLGLIYLYFIKPADYWKKRGVTSLDTWSAHKNILNVILRRISFMENIVNSYNAFPDARYVGWVTFNRPQFFVRDVNLIKQITIKDFDNFINREVQIDVKNERYISKVLLMLEDEEWRDMRAILSPTFTTSKMKFIYSLMSECAQNFVNYFEKNQHETENLEMKDVFSRFAMDAIATSSFGISINSLEKKDNEFFTYAKRTVNTRSWKMALVFLGVMIPFTRKIFRIQFIDSEVGEFFQGVINETLAVRREKNVTRPDMIHLLLQAQLPQDGDKKGAPKKTLTDEELTSQGIMFFLAGFDAIATTLSFILYELALNKKIHDHLQSEIDEAWSNSKDGQISYDVLMNLKYMDCVVSEGLRKWPPGIFFDRLCKRDYVIESTSENEKSIVLPKGTHVFIPVYAIHHDPKYFPKPEVFDPDRFNDENKTKIVSGSYMPFGAGPRICLASRFALMEVKVMLVHLLSKFNVDVTEKTPIPFVIDKSNFNLAAEGGIWLRFNKRSVS